jgi:flavin reductase
MTASPDVSMQMFRDGMARLGASVNVITSDGTSGRLGFTATSVCSVSDNPPSLLVCMNRNSTQNAPLKANGVLCVNILASDHKKLSAAFAVADELDSESRFKLATWSSLQPAHQCSRTRSRLLTVR